MLRILAYIVTCLSLCASLVAANAVAENASDYRLAPGDQVVVTVFGNKELSGRFLIDGAGNIQLPLAGSISLRGHSLADAENLITARLADGYINEPAVSIRISAHRPIYVLGHVKTPGSYKFQHGTTVKSAIALAGGYGLAIGEESAAMSNYLLAEERVRILESEFKTLTVRLARLEAQRDGRDHFTAGTFPASISGPGSMVADIVASEQELFRNQVLSHRRQNDLLRRQKPRLENEIAAIKAQIETEKTQEKLVKSRLREITKLYKAYLTRGSTVLELKREVARHQGNISRHSAELARLDTMLGELDISIERSRAEYHAKVMQELQTTRTRLHVIKTSLPQAREIREVRLERTNYMSVATSTEPGKPAPAPTHILTVTRTHDGKANKIAVSEQTLLQPGDIVEVSRIRPARAGLAPSQPERPAVSSPPLPTKKKATRLQEANVIGPAPRHISKPAIATRVKNTLAR